jgi:hypothetical protein
MKPLHELLQERRTTLGLDENKVASILTLTPESYWDLEHHRDEWNTVTPFYTIRFVCGWFGINLLDQLFSTEGIDVPPRLEMHKFIQQRRLELQMTADEFADACGFYPVFAKLVEADNGIILYPFEVSRLVCSALKVDVKSFARSLLTAL